MVLHRSQRTPAYRVLRGSSSPLQRELAPRSACVGLGLFLGHSLIPSFSRRTNRATSSASAFSAHS